MTLRQLFKAIYWEAKFMKYVQIYGYPKDFQDLPDQNMVLGGLDPMRFWFLSKRADWALVMDDRLR